MKPNWISTLTSSGSVKFSTPNLNKRDGPTQVLNGNSYYSLPTEMPKLSHQLKNALDAASRCNNCANADALFPMHSWKRCPFHTPPHRASAWPVHHSPIPSIAATPAVQKVFFLIQLAENHEKLEDIKFPEEPPPKGYPKAPLLPRPLGHAPRIIIDLSFPILRSGSGLFHWGD